MDYIITTEQLTKKYKNFISVNNVSLHIRKGSIYGFLGPNGAGKSTTMKMLLGLTAPTKGSFTIDGKQFPGDRIAILKEIGSFIEAPSFYANLTGRENLDIIRRILGLPKADVEDALELVGLTEFGDRLAKKYSLGMKQRLGLAGALLGRPPILILDEPTNGLDPAGIQEMRALIHDMPDACGATVLISSHLLGEMEQIVSQVGIINHGQLLFEGPLAELQRHSRGNVVLRLLAPDRGAAVLRRYGLTPQPADNGCLLPTMEDARLAALVQDLAAEGAGVVGVERQTKNLEEIFLSLTNTQTGKEVG